MTTEDLIAQAHQKSVALYLHRQQIEIQRQRVLVEAAQADAELLRLDGELRVLMEIHQALLDETKVQGS